MKFKELNEYSAMYNIMRKHAMENLRNGISDVRAVRTYKYWDIDNPYDKES